MYTGKLDMLHNSRYVSMFAVADRICLALHCMTQETVDQDPDGPVSHLLLLPCKFSDFPDHIQLPCRVRQVHRKDVP